MRRIAILPARGGSKRIPNKNIKDFNGKPIIAYILHALKQSNLFNEIHVSTESSLIADVVRRCGTDIKFPRPDDLADDYTTIMPVVQYVISKYRELGIEYDEVWIVMPCTPLIDCDDIKRAADAFIDKKNNGPMIAVAEYPVPIEWAFSMNHIGELSPVKPGAFSIRSQDLGKKYYDAGAFSVYTSEHLKGLAMNSLDVGMSGFILSSEKVVDIDDMNSWNLAESLYLSKIGKKFLNE
jgi:N-acylneuraminate cytidylyltransferase